MSPAPSSIQKKETPLLAFYELSSHILPFPNMILSMWAMYTIVSGVLTVNCWNPHWNGESCDCVSEIWLWYGNDNCKILFLCFNSWGVGFWIIHISLYLDWIYFCMEAKCFFGFTLKSVGVNTWFQSSSMYITISLNSYILLYQLSASSYEGPSSYRWLAVF